MELNIAREQSKEEGKGKESIQLSNTHDPGLGMGAKRSALSQQVTTRLREIDMTGKTH